jgi:MFS transporter, DHA1 family, multidrug resistance protein
MAARPRHLATDNRRFVYLLPALTAVQALSTDLYLPALPAIVAAFGADIAKGQLTLSVFLLGFALAQLVYGPVSDRFGRRPALLAGTALYFLASLACLFAGSIEALILSRLVQGIGACAGPVLGRAVVRDLYEPREAVRVLAYLSAATALAPTLGPVLGGYLTLAFGWRASFAALAVFSAVTLVGTFLLLPETNSRPDLSGLRPGALVANYLRLLRSRAYVAYVLIAALAYSGIFAFISGSPHVLIDILGLPPQIFGLCFGTGVLGYIVGTLSAARLGRRLSPDRLIRFGALVSMAGAGLGLVLALVFPPSVLGIVAPMVIVLVGAGFTLPATLAGALAPFPQQAGLASALLGFLQLLTAAGIGVLIGLLYELDPSPRPMMLALAVVALAAVLIAQHLKPLAPASSGDEPG